MSHSNGATLEERLDLAFEFSKAGELTAQHTQEATALVRCLYDTLRGMLAGTITLDDPMGFTTDLDKLATIAREVVVQRNTDDMSLANRLNGSRK